MRQLASGHARPLTSILLAGAVLLSAGPVAAASSRDAATSLAAAPPLAIDGPDAPVPPAMMARDERGRATVRATRLEAPLEFDGRLDEPVYGRVPAVSGFIQQIPSEGEPATELTEVWIFFDDRNMYVAARCTDSHPERIEANEQRRDHNNLFWLDDSLSVMLDTFYDRRNGVSFQTNPLGSLRDVAITDGRPQDTWSTVWDVKAARTDTGYSVEMMIPFRSLRFPVSGPQMWGINVRRVVKWKNETSTLTPVPASYGIIGALRMNVAGTLVGIETPRSALNMEVKPYALAASTTDLAARVPTRNQGSGDVGVDVKYGITKGLTADLTVNTDFAQVEEDQQQVNLTRFNLLFPEKRDFFLEGAGIFEFGGVHPGAQTAGDVPILFFSRRIGLADGRAVPVTAGGRVTGRTGPFDVGALVVRTGESLDAGAPATTFSAIRVRRDFLRLSKIGFIATGRWPGGAGAGSSATIGVDANLRFFTNVEGTAYWARTSTPGRDGDDASYRGWLAYEGDRWGAGVDHVTVQRNFAPDVGFLRRTDFSASTVQARFSPRLRGHPFIRRFNWNASLAYVTNAARTRLEDRTLTAEFTTEFHNSDEVTLRLTRVREVPPVAFTIAPGILVPASTYTYDTVTAEYVLRAPRPFAGTALLSRGSFYDGARTAVEYNTGRVGFSSRFAVEPTLSLNWVSLPQGEVTTRLFGNRFIVTPSPRLSFGSLVQFNTTAQTLTASARLRWEYTPGSELFVVYSDGRDTSVRGYPDLVSRSFAVKITRLLRL